MGYLLSYSVITLACSVSKYRSGRDTIVGGHDSRQNYGVTFEEFVTHAVRNRPEEEQWQLQVCYALLGLAGETAQLVELARQLSVGSYYGSTTSLLRRLGPFEFYRALAYYQLDKRPGQLVPSGEKFARLFEFAEGMMVQVGSLNIQVKDWLYHRQALDDRADDALRNFEVARRSFYRLLQVDPQDVWELHVAGLAKQQFVPPTHLHHRGVGASAGGPFLVVPFLSAAGESTSRQ